jgi:hypothetical protein
MRPKLHFLVMPEMDREPHRWDSCCREWLAGEWEFLSYWLPRPQYWRLLNRLGPQMLGRSARTIFTGKCPMHGKRLPTDAEVERLMLEEGPDAA